MNIKSEVIKNFNEVKDLIFLNLEDVQIKEGCRLEFLSAANIWVLNEFFNLKNSKELDENRLEQFIEKSLCYWYFNMIKPFIYDKEYPFRKDLYLISAYIFDNIEKLTGNKNFVLSNNENIDAEVTKIWELKSKKEFAKYVINEVNQVITIVQSIINEIESFNIPGYYENSIVKHLNLGLNVFSGKSYDEWILFMTRVCGVNKIQIKYIGKDADKFEFNYSIQDTHAIEEDIMILEKIKEKMDFEKNRANSLLTNNGFVEKAPAQKISEENEKLNSFEKTILKIEVIQEKYKKLLAG